MIWPNAHDIHMFIDGAIFGACCLNLAQTVPSLIRKIKARNQN
jgi:hypothetical protein